MGVVPRGIRSSSWAFHQIVERPAGQSTGWVDFFLGGPVRRWVTAFQDPFPPHRMNRAPRAGITVEPKVAVFAQIRPVSGPQASLTPPAMHSYTSPPVLVG